MISIVKQILFIPWRDLIIWESEEQDVKEDWV